MENRYRDQHFLRLLELYVLWSIGQLQEKERLILENMTPTLQEIYNHQGTWHEIIEVVMQFSSNAKVAILDVWERNQQIAKENNTTLDPEYFARMFVDTNFKK